MGVQFDEAWMLATVLLWARISALLFLSPFVSAARLPAIFTVLFGLVLSGLLTASFPQYWPATPMAPLGWALGLSTEVLTGALLGFALQCAFGALSMAGRVLDLQMGLGIGAVFDPVTRSNTPVLGAVLALFGGAIFFGMEAHHAFIQGIAYSLKTVPLGTGLWSLSATDVVRPVAAMFSTALAVIAPVLFLLLLVELALMMASRVLPQMNVFFVAIPIKLLTGLSVLALTAGVIGPVMSRSYAEVFRFWDGVLR